MPSYLKRNVIRRLALALVAICAASLVAACGREAGAPDTAAPTPAPTPTPERFKPRFAYEPCTVELPDGQQVGETAACGTLTVPEHRAASTGRTIELAVVVLRATASVPAPDPLIYLSGGPGGPALEFDLQEFSRDFAEPIQRKRDIVFFDQRGVGRSQPALDCPEIDDAFAADLEGEATYASAIVECRNRLRRDGVDLDAYNSVENAADIADLAEALGYERYNLYGVSYGTRLALTAMRDRPQPVRSAILDSVFPLQANLYTDAAATLEESLQSLFDACAADAGCRSFAPDLRQTFLDAAARLDARPLTISQDDGAGGTSDFDVDGDTFVNLMFQAMYSTYLIPFLPSAIVLISEGSDEPLRSLASYADEAAGGNSVGMYLSVQCSEEVPFNTSATIRLARDPALARLNPAASNEVDSIRSECGAWNVARQPLRENEAVRSDIPSLVLSGQFDPITPPSYARETVRTLDTAYLFEFPGYGHGILEEGCAMAIVAAFLDDPKTKPDGRCIDDLPPVEFKAP